MNLTFLLPAFFLISFTVIYFCSTSRSQLSPYLTGFMTILLVLGLSIVAYGIQPVPGYTVDFERISNELYQIKIGEFDEVKLSYSLNPLSAYYIYIGYIFNNVNIIKFFSALIMYGALLYIPFSEWNNNKINSTSFSLTVLFILATTDCPGLVLGVRQGPAFALSALGAYLILIKKRYISGLIISIVSVFLHISCLVPLLAIIVALISNRRIRNLLYCVTVLYSFLTYNFSQMLSANPFAQSLLQKMNMYYAFGDSYTLATSTRLQVVAILMAICCPTFYAISKYYRNNTKYYISYNRFYLVIIFFILGSIVTSTPLRRYVLLAWFTCVPLFGGIVQKFLPERHLITNSRNTDSSLIPTYPKHATYAAYTAFIYCACIIFFVALIRFNSYKSYYFSFHQIFM